MIPFKVKMLVIGFVALTVVSALGTAIEVVRASYSDQTLSFQRTRVCSTVGPCESFWNIVETCSGGFASGSSTIWINHTGSAAGPWVLEIGFNNVRKFISDGLELYNAHGSAIFLDPTTPYRDWMMNRHGPREFLIWINSTPSTCVPNWGEMRNIPEPTRVIVDTNLDVDNDEVILTPQEDVWTYYSANDTLILDRDQITTASEYDVLYEVGGGSGPIHDPDVKIVAEHPVWWDQRWHFSATTKWTPQQCRWLVPFGETLRIIETCDPIEVEFPFAVYTTYRITFIAHDPGGLSHVAQYDVTQDNRWVVVLLITLIIAVAVILLLRWKEKWISVSTWKWPGQR